MAQPLIEVNGISKQYIIKHDQRAAYGSLRDELTAFGRNPLRYLNRKRRTPELFWALRDVTFSVERGDCIGVVGRNGSGKSTLLKILSRIVEPTKGRAVLRGEVASLLEVGTGFHPELTGRENIYFNGSVLGMTRRQITSRFDEIVAFADTEKFLDTPVKFYSSGMYVRLAFAVAAHLDPDILIVDEVLAVGDASFQAKCLSKMSTTAKEGRTILFVSHNLHAVRRLCNKGLLLDSGNLVCAGSAEDVAEKYIQSGENPTTGLPLNRRKRASNLTLEARFETITLDQERTLDGSKLDSTRPLTVKLQIDSSRDIDRPVAVHIAVFNAGQMILRFESEHNGLTLRLRKGANQVSCAMQPTYLSGGHYSLSCSLLYVGGEHIGHIDSVPEALTFIAQDVLLQDGSPITQREAVYWAPHSWRADD
jgi:lipopolysaccharide transport system ATP-binding protein